MRNLRQNMETIKTNKSDTKKQMLEALERSLGIVTTACNAVDINRSYDWLKKDNDYADESETSKGAHLTLQRVTCTSSSKRATLCHHLLKTRGKAGGYVERQEIEVAEESRYLGLGTTIARCHDWTRMKQPATYYHVKESKAKIQVHQGGTRSGKTYSILTALVELCYRSENAGAVITIARKTFPAVRASVMRDFFNILHREDIYDPELHNKSEATYRLYGNLVEFISVDQPQRSGDAQRMPSTRRTS